MVGSRQLEVHGAGNGASGNRDVRSSSVTNRCHLPRSSLPYCAPQNRGKRSIVRKHVHGVFGFCTSFTRRERPRCLLREYILLAVMTMKCNKETRVWKYVLELLFPKFRVRYRPLEQEDDLELERRHRFRVWELRNILLSPGGSILHHLFQ